ncbi:hypothetical protein [Variovorax ginsengisoli]|uniref:Uncharacterized protein n=1 Tax=Variovorax ginsengisoli TaxID=363844 RepID=A0ABT8SG90_9BURK|nr:hypothetical protein [Variovorax ginsengisoli]MDN8618770.1 hypothetical protein [Variovorax ginsengisoli]MDO1537940.1 hypothetical protein [Variovorax ginsengisoli]
MRWSECYGKIQQLSPKAAKLASRMLCKDPRVPSHWAFALDVALAGRGKAAGGFTSADLDAIGASQRQERPEPTAELDPAQQEAWTFAASVRKSAAGGANKGAQAPKLSPEDAEWDPRTPTPEEAWLLAFSQELQRISDLSPDDIARRALRRLETDGDRNPLEAARDELVASEVENVAPHQNVGIPPEGGY